MIFVDRSTVPIPEQLKAPRTLAERQKIAELLSGSRERLEQTRINFRSEIYFAAKPALVELFHGKCAYCESEVTKTGVVDVEHFRPKAGVEEADGRRTHYYYAWLAYEWDNLLIACAACNRPGRSEGRIVGKGDKFPVEGNRARLLADVSECRRTENYLLLDPCYDHPEEHLSFDANGFCIPKTGRGQVAIEIHGLNRQALVQARLSTWYEVTERAQQIIEFASDLEPEPLLEWLGVLHTLLDGSRPYTAVARFAFQEKAADLAARVMELKNPAAISILSGLLSVGKLKPPLSAEPKGEVEFAVEFATEVTSLAEPRRQYKGRAELPPYARETIRRIEVRNFKAIEALDFELPEPQAGEAERTPALMLLGENATGKSSMLEAIALALLGAEQIARLGLDGKTFVRRNRQAGASKADGEPSAPAEVTIYFSGDEPPVRLTIDPHSGQFQGEAQPATVLLGYGPRRFFSDQRRVARSPEQAERVRTLFDPLAVIGNPTSWLINCGQVNWNAAIRALRALLLMPPEALVSRPAHGKRRGAEIMFSVQDEPEPLRRLSEGYKTTVATSVDIMREMLRYWPDLEVARGVVLIDEIETHLHPRWKMRIVGRLRQALPNVQFIATTHDPLCLRGLWDGEAQVLQRDEQRRIERATDLPSVRGLSVEQLLNSEYFGLFSTEDPRFEEDLAHYVALAARRDRSPDEEAELEEYRRQMHAKVVLGVTPESSVIQTALAEYLAQARTASAHEKPALKREAVNKVLELWQSFDAEDEAQ